MTNWELFNAFFQYIGELAVFLTLVSLVHRQTATRLGCMWVNYAHAQKRFFEIFKENYRRDLPVLLKEVE